MNKIESLNPEQFLEKSKAKRFSICIITPEYQLLRTTNGWVNPDGPKLDEYTIAEFTRTDLVEGYFESLRDARDSIGYGSPFLQGGDLQIMELEES